MQTRKSQKLIHIGVALTFALIFGGASGAVYLYRDSLFTWSWARPAGVFTASRDESLFANALLYMEKVAARPGDVCVGQWIGKDERYVYMAIGCGQFERRLGAIEASGDQSFHATRLRYSGGEIEHFEQPDETEFRNSVRKLFPKEAAQRLMVSMNADVYKEMGLKKMGRL